MEYKFTKPILDHSDSPRDATQVENGHILLFSKNYTSLLSHPAWALELSSPSKRAHYSGE